jgi:hypothetical protein
VNKHRTAKDFPDSKAIGKKVHCSFAVIGKKHRKVAGMVAVRLIIWIPMFPSSQKRHRRIPDLAVAKHMDVKTMGTDRISTWGSRLIRRRSSLVSMGRLLSFIFCNLFKPQPFALRCPSCFPDNTSHPNLRGYSFSFCLGELEHPEHSLSSRSFLNNGEENVKNKIRPDWAVDAR